MITSRYYELLKTAIEKDQEVGVAHLVASKAFALDKSTVISDSLTAIEFAVQKQKPEIIKILLNESFTTAAALQKAIEAAANAGYWDCVKVFAETPNLQNWTAQLAGLTSALHLASSAKNLQMIGDLLDAGANASAETKAENQKKGLKPIQLAFQNFNDDSAQAAIVFISKIKSDPKNQYAFGDVLVIAAQNKRANLVDLFLGAQTVVTCTDELGNTPLHWAVKNKRKKMVEDLIAAGAIPSVGNLEGETPLSLAADNVEIMVPLLAAQEKVEQIKKDEEVRRIQREQEEKRLLEEKQKQAKETMRQESFKFLSRSSDKTLIKDAAREFCNAGSVTATQGLAKYFQEMNNNADKKLIWTYLFALYCPDNPTAQKYLADIEKQKNSDMLHEYFIESKEFLQGLKKQFPNMEPINLLLLAVRKQQQSGPANMFKPYELVKFKIENCISSMMGDEAGFTLEESSRFMQGKTSIVDRYCEMTKPVAPQEGMTTAKLLRAMPPGAKIEPNSSVASAAKVVTLENDEASTVKQPTAQPNQPTSTSLYPRFS